VPLRRRFVKPVVCPASRVRLQTRVFSDLGVYCNLGEYQGGRNQPGKNPSEEFVEGKIKLSDALLKMKDYNYSRSSPKYLEDRDRMLEGLGILENLANNEQYRSEGCNARKLLDAVMQPISEDLHGLDAGTRSKVLEASLRVICLVLKAATVKIGLALRSDISTKDEVKSSIERIRDSGGWDDQIKRTLAEEILAQLPSTPK